jgi:ABC-type transport system involved in multi-copper enzyme maturation permease subunit
MLHSMPIYIAFGIMLLMIGASVYMMEPGAVGMVTSDGTELVESGQNEEESSGINEQEGSDRSISDYRKAMKKSSEYKLDRDILAQNMNLYYVFIFVAALALAVDFSGGNIKNTLSSAISRKKYFISKSVFIALFCLVLFFANTYITYFSNLIFNGAKMSSGLGAVTKISLLQLPEVLALTSFLTGVAFLTKKTSIFNTVTISFIMLFQLLLSLVTSVFHIKKKYLNYELQTMFGKLANHPSKEYMLHGYILCGILIVVCYVIGYLAFRKAEIK